MKKYVFIAIGLLLAAGVTIPKLYRMAQIRGFIGGAVTEEKVITRVWHQTPDGQNGKNIYWISWTADDIKKKGDHRINVEKELFERIKVNDKVPFVKIPGESELYLPNGIYASTGNFIFDGALLFIELGAVVYGLLLFRKKE